jgi:hypothetical protein
VTSLSVISTMFGILKDIGARRRFVHNDVSSV